MGNTIQSAKRTCQNVFTFSKASVSVGPPPDDADADAGAAGAAGVGADGTVHNEEMTEEYVAFLNEERVRREKLEREHEEALMRLREVKDQQFEADRRRAAESVQGQVSMELEELRTTIRQLSEDLSKPMEEVEQVLEHWKSPYSKLDDYVLETMYALLHWLGTRPEFARLSMAQLLFYLKSPHIRARRKYVMRCERILRETGLSLFDLQQTCNPVKLAGYFDVVRKRAALARVAAEQVDVDHLVVKQEGSRATWHAIVA